MSEVEAIQEKQESDSEEDYESDEYSDEDTSKPAKKLCVSPDEVVKLDVGGQLFKTQSEPLKKKSRFFKNLLGSKSIERNGDGSVIIDRSPKHFDFILNFVRDGYAPFPSSEADATEILAEAKFYKMVGLVKRFAIKNSKLPFETASLDEIKAKANGALDKPLLQIFFLFDDKRGLVNQPSSFSEPFIKDFLKKHENFTIQFYQVDYKFHSYTAAWSYRLFNKSGYEVYGPRDSSFETFTQQLESDIKNIDKPTNQKPKTDESKIESVEMDEPKEVYGKCQLIAVLNALDKVSKKEKPGIFNISTTSKYVYNCFNEWIYQWQANGWLTTEGKPVANQYLLKIILNKIRELRNIGKMKSIILKEEDVKKPDTPKSS